MRSMTREHLLLIVLATLWGASYTFIKIGVETIPPVTLIAGRTLIAAILLLAFVRWRGLVLPKDRVTWRRFLIQACLNSAIPFTLIAWGERSVDAGLATVLNSTAPIFTFLITAVVTRHEPVTARKLFGVAFGIAGVCLIVGIESLPGLGQLHFQRLSQQLSQQLLAPIAIVAATICYAGAAIFGKSFKELDPTLPAAGSLICGAAILSPVSLVIDQPWTLAPSRESMLALIGLSVFSTALALVIYFRLVQTLGSVGVTSQAYLRVPIGVAIGMVFLGETLSLAMWIGLACVVIGVAAMTVSDRAAH